MLLAVGTATVADTGPADSVVVAAAAVPGCTALVGYTPAEVVPG